MSRDPIGERGGRNLHSFICNNSFNISDDLGLRKQTPEEESIINCLNDIYKLLNINKNEHNLKFKKIIDSLIKVIEETPEGCKLKSNIQVLLKALKNFCNPSRIYIGTKIFYCSIFVRSSALGQAGFRSANHDLNAAAYLNYTDERMLSIGLNLPITNSPEPGDIVSSGSANARRTNDAHTGIYIGEGLYVGQSPLPFPGEITGNVKGSTIKIRPVSSMPNKRIVYRSTGNLK